MRRIWIFLVLWLCLLGTAAAFSLPWQQKPQAQPEFLQPEEVLLVAPATDNGQAWQARAHIVDGYYVYRHSLSAEDASGRQLDLQLPDGERHHDEFFGDVEIYRQDVLALGLPDDAQQPVTLHWQGCADAGICYPPQTLQLAFVDQGGAGGALDELFGSSSSSSPGASAAINFPAAEGAAGVAASAAMPSSQASGVLADDQMLAGRLSELHPAVATALFFGLGLLLAFTPCSLPMIPIMSAIVVGSGARPRRAFSLTAAYVLAMALTYAALGVAAGLAGANLQAALQSPWLLGTLSALFVFLALPLFGLFELQLPRALSTRLEAASRQQTGGHLGGAGALGVLSALLVGPCMTAPLAGALLYIGQSGNAVLGGSALFALGLGMGLPLLAIAVFGARVLPRPGPWMNRIKVIFGYVMLALAIYLLAPFLPAALSLLLWGALGLGLAAGLLRWVRAATLQGRLGWSLGLGAVLASVWSVMLLVGAASGGDSALRPLAHLARGASGGQVAPPVYVTAKSLQDVQDRLAMAGEQGQWTLIDFYADWCVSCRVNERRVFQDPTVASRLAQMQVLRPDVTANDTIDQALMAHWEVLGPPTMMLIGPDGQEVRAQRMVGELSAREFLRKLNAAGVS